MSDSVRPLDDVTVVDFSQLIAGPSAAVMLGDLGAKVIKVERRDGELARDIGAIDGIVPTIVVYNRGKQSLAVDLGSDQGRDIVRRLIESADVVIQGFRPGVMDRLGLGAREMRAANPRVVYASVSAFRGSSRPGVDSMIQAATGIMSYTGFPDGVPTKVGFQMVDAAAGLALGQGILAALLQRERTGEGSEVAISLFEVATFVQSPAFLTVGLTGRSPVRQGNTAGQMGYPTDMFPTAGGGHVFTAAYFPAQFTLLCEQLGIPEVAQDDRFSTGQGRIQNEAELREILTAAFMTKTAAEWDAILTEAGVIASAVNDHLTILENPELRELGSFEQVKSARGHQGWMPRVPYRSSGWESPMEWNPPEPGEHTAGVLADLGYSDDEIAELTEQQIVGAQE